MVLVYVRKVKRDKVADNDAKKIITTKKNYTKKSIKQPLVNKLSIYDHPYMQHQLITPSHTNKAVPWVLLSVSLID